MCSTYHIRAEKEDGTPFPGAPSPVEFDESQGECLCSMTDNNELSRKQFADFAEALRPFVKAVSWGNIIIEKR